jgi:hypothetical protein
MAFGIFEFQHPSINGVVQMPAEGFVLGTGLALHKQGADVGQGSGATNGNAVVGECIKELAQNMVDVNVGGEITGRAGELCGKVGL